jgi:type I restriction enzyme S subunit
MGKHTTSKVPQIRFKGFEGGWEKRQFKDIVSSLLGGASIKPEDYQSYGVRTVPKGAVNSTGIANLAGSKFVSKEFFKIKTTSQVSTGDLVTSLRDLVPSAPNLGRVVKIKGTSEDFLMPQGVYKITLHSNIDENFVISYSNAGEFRKVISSEKNGSTQVHLRNGEFLDITIFTPTHSEQIQVGECFRELDRLIELHQRKHDKLVTLKQAMLQKMFPQAGAAIPEIRFKGFSGDWVERPLHELADRYDNLRVPISAGNRVPGSTPYYGANGIQGYVQGYTHEGQFILVAEDGANDVKSYPVQYVAGKIWVNNHAHVLQAKEGLVETLFLQYAFSQINFEVFLVGGGRSKLNAATMMKINLCAPKDIKEQQQIGTYFRQLDALISKHAIQRQKLKQIKTACLEKMFV